MTNTIYAFIRRPASAGYELKTYSPAEFAAEFKLDRSYEEWTAAGHDLDDVIEFDDVMEANSFINAELGQGAITPENHIELLKALCALSGADIPHYVSEFDCLIKQADNKALKRAYSFLQDLEAANYLVSLDLLSLSDLQMKALRNREDFRRACRYVGANYIAEAKWIDDAALRGADPAEWASLECVAMIDARGQSWAEFGVQDNLYFRAAAGVWYVHASTYEGDKYFDVVFASAAENLLNETAERAADIGCAIER